MSNSLLALMLAAGVSGWVYSKMVRRFGEGNTKSLWTIIAVCFVLVFAFFWTFTRYVIHLH
ncbi:MAG TPA: hypothetical protein VFN56_02985 [Candidatus Saccharimonadales bacterium]|nr:hypothetical protein [Candidatus Saccharimonadales bacterium]